MIPKTEKVGIIGTGVGIRTHLAGFQALSNVELVGVVGSSMDRSKMHLADAGFDPNLAVSLDELLDSNPDLVSLTTPPGQRSQYVEALKGYSGQVLIEKPVAITANEARSFQTALESASAAYSGFQLRGLPAFRWIRDKVASGELGTVYSVSLLERTSAFRQKSIAAWQESRQTGGGQAFAMGSHLVDLGIFLADRQYSDINWSEKAMFGQTRAPRRGWTNVPPSQASSDEVFQASFAVDSTTVRIFTSSISPGLRTLEFLIEGTEGTVEFKYRQGFGTVTCFDSAGIPTEYWLGSSGVVEANEADKEQLNNSVFRVAFPHYAADLFEADDTRLASNIATLADGVQNARLLDALVTEIDQG